MTTIMMESHSGEWTLTEAARLLGEPQHRLIYLCEKGVVQPDVQDAEGRGSSRRFSARNLLEFAVALRLRGLEIPASFVAAVIYVLLALMHTPPKGGGPVVGSNSLRWWTREKSNVRTIYNQKVPEINGRVSFLQPR